jgi:hypothetical protein
MLIKKKCSGESEEIFEFWECDSYSSLEKENEREKF